MPDTHTTTYEDILYRVDQGVAWITLNRPDKLNAWRGEMDRDVRAAMRVASDDPEVRVIVLTGAARILREPGIFQKQNRPGVSSGAASCQRGDTSCSR
ncbi:MAG: enoyl-CoA hydratase-related protein [Hyphomonadaceae bacterium]|nr:enoyl-CoA hydratase-related protein [Hyphomonadaceae bacterium]